MQKRFHALRLVSAIYKLAGFLLGALSVLSFIFSLYVAIVRPDDLYPTNVANASLWIIILGALSIMIGMILSVLIFGSGVILDLFLSLEEQSRAQTAYLRRISQGQARRTAAQPSAPQPSATRPPPTRPLRTDTPTAVRQRQDTVPMPPEDAEEDHFQS